MGIYCVARFLSPVEQGYYYTFSSILGLNIFFELGLTFVIMQFASHEKAGLEWTDAGDLTGNERNLKRLGSLLRFAVRWYGIAAIISLIGISLGGCWFFRTSHHDGANVQWMIPWLSVCLASSISFFLAPIYGILEGCGKIAEMNGLFAKQAILSSIVFWIALFGGLKLFAVPLLAMIPLLVAGPILFSKYFKALLTLWRVSAGGEETISWKKEILPLQWKISLSWASGYFIFQLAAPVLFRTHGAVLAGQYGMSLKMIESIQSLSQAWTSTKAATFGTLIAKREFMNLKKLFRATMFGSLGANILFSLGFLGLIVGLHLMKMPLAARFLPTSLLSLMCLNAFLNCVIFSIACLLRAEKKEPLFGLSIVAAILNTLAVMTLGIHYGPIGIIVPLLAVNFFLALPVLFYFWRDFWRRSIQISQV